MTILGKIIDTIMIAFYVAFCLIGAASAIGAVMEGVYWLTVVVLVFTTLFAVKCSPWSVEVPVPYWLINAIHACGRAADRTADAINFVGGATVYVLKELWGRVVVFFVCTVCPMILAIVVFSSGAVTGLLVLILAALVVIAVILAKENQS